MLSADAIVSLHDQLTRAWHREPDSPEPPSAGANNVRLRLAIGSTVVARQHRANFDLWHIEDEARTPGATDADSPT